MRVMALTEPGLWIIVRVRANRYRGDQNKISVILQTVCGQIAAGMQNCVLNADLCQCQVVLSPTDCSVEISGGYSW